PSSSVRNGWAKTGWLSEVADPWARTIGVISPTADRIAPAVVGLASTAGAAIQELPARRVTTETRLRPTRVRRDAVNADIETPFTFDWTAILRRTGRPVETVLCRRSSWARMGPRGSRMMGGCRTKSPGPCGLEPSAPRGEVCVDSLAAGASGVRFTRTAFSHAGLQRPRVWERRPPAGAGAAAARGADGRPASDRPGASVRTRPASGPGSADRDPGRDSLAG